MDWPVLGSDVFLATAVIVLLASPIVGAAGTRSMPVALRLGVGVFCLSLALLIFSWRSIPGGWRAALFGHLALAIAALTLAAVGRLLRRWLGRPLGASFAGLVVSTVVVLGIFALGPALADLPLRASQWILAANPLVTTASAAGIDLLHLDVIYRTSPLAHRGVTSPAWINACTLYFIVGLACYGLSLIRPRRAPQS